MRYAICDMQYVICNMLFEQLSHLALPIDPGRWKSRGIAGESKTEKYFFCIFCIMYFFSLVYSFVFVFVLSIFCVIVFMSATVKSLIWQVRARLKH